MNPTLVVMAVRAALRLVRTGEQAFGQYARDRAVMLPMLEMPKFSELEGMIGFFEINEDQLTPELKRAWKSFRKKDGAPHVAGDFDLISSEYVRQQAALDAKIKPFADEMTGLWMVQQWSNEKQPAGPIARVVLTIVDVAAEFAAQDPKLFGIGGNAEVVIQALATHVSAFIPDNTDDLGPKNRLGERLAGMFLKSALAALSEHPDVIIDQDHVQRLVKGTLPTLVAAFPKTLEDQMNWRGVMDSLLGPVAQQGMKALAEDPRAFFGKKFGDDGLLGPLTSTYLLKAAELGFEQTFSRAGAVEIYKATVAFAAARPELFFGDPTKASNALLTQVFKDLTAVMQAHSPPFDRHLLGQLGAVALEAAARAGGAQLDPSKPWENVLANLLTPVVAATSEALKTGDRGALRRLASQANLQDFVLIIVTQIAATPGMVTGTKNPEVNRLVAALASAMAADENLLLSQADWMSVVAVAVSEVAANPGRLLGLNENSPTETLLATLLKDLVGVAIAQWKIDGRAGSTVLFGETLREAMITVIRASASQAVAALLNSAQIKNLAAQITALVAAKPGVYGSKEWVYLYRALVTQVIDTGALPDPLDEATINAALAAATGVAA